MKNYSLQELIGNTPLVKIRNLDTGCCELFIKMECLNPGGSIKDRIALAMIEVAERDGKIKPGGTLVEATAGNTGLALAQIAAAKAYKLIVIVPDKMSREKIDHLRATGAEVILTRSDINKGHPEYYQDLAERIAKERNAFYVNQFNNPANPAAHEKTTAPEIWEQMGHNLDAIVCGAGTGGHLTGLGRYFKRVAPHVTLVLADPAGSILTDYVNTGVITEKNSKWLVEGIGEDFIPPTCEIDFAQEAISVNDAESFAAARELLKKEGLFAGSSTGTVLHAALKYCRAQTKPKRVVTFAYDSGNKYLSKMYNDEWMKEKGMLELVTPQYK